MVVVVVVVVGGAAAATAAGATKPASRSGSLRARGVIRVTLSVAKVVARGTLKAVAIPWRVSGTHTVVSNSELFPYVSYGALLKRAFLLTF